ncbi:MAG: methionine--tRNA ligase [Candidatus Nealsonbacteria bacterium]
MSKNNFYITTSIAYTNAAPHIGFALELIQADVLARYHRSLGEKVWFLTGTDEHGIKIVKAADKAGKDVVDFTNDISSKFEKLTKVLDISNDDFIRTTDQKRHWPTVEKIWEQLLTKGDIYKNKYKGLYCVGCEAFVKEKDLVNGNCPNHQQKPEEIEEENYFFKLSKYADEIKELIEKDEIKIIPQNRKNEILSFIDQGVEDISCSRSKENLKWGIPVPGDENQIVYIWFEALTNYLSALVSSGKEDFWPADIHCIGKDIFRFHVLLWPAILLAIDKELPKNIFVHGYITSNGEKMSKSLGNVIDPFELVKKYGVDPVRYFLLREFSSTEDGDFTFEKFEERYNSDLAKGLGNLISRVFKLLETVKVENGSNLASNIEKTKENYEKALADLKFNEALVVIWSLITDCDKYIEKVKPWEDIQNKKEEIASLVTAIKEIEVLLRPFLPETSEKILKQLKENKSEPLFPRI